jgi:hypothetical protein
MMQERRNHQLTIRIPKRIRVAIDAQATREQCTVADIVNHLFAATYPARVPKERRR